MKICPKCNKEVEETEEVCKECGYKFEQPVINEEQTEAVYEVPTPEQELQEVTELTEEIEETETVVKQKKKKETVFLIICFAVIIALGLGMALGSWFYVKPKYTKAIEQTQADMANYGMYYGLYQVSSEDEDTANMYAYYAQITAQAYETDKKTAENYSYWLYGAFLLSGIMIAVGTTSLCFMLANKKDDGENKQEEYTGSFEDILNEISDLETAQEEPSNITEEPVEEENLEIPPVPEV